MFRSKKVFPYIVLFTSLLLAFAFPKAWSTVLLKMDTEALTKKANRIITGKVKGLNYEIDQKGIPYTFITITVDKHLKTPPGERQLNEITLRQPGGPKGNLYLWIPGMPEFAPGEEVLLFLEKDPLVPNYFIVLGMFQGKWKLEKDMTSGKIMAVNYPPPAPFSKAKPAAALQRLALEELVQKVNQVILRQNSGGRG